MEDMVDLIYHRCTEALKRPCDDGDGDTRIWTEVVLDGRPRLEWEVWREAGCSVAALLGRVNDCLLRGEVYEDAERIIFRYEARGE